MTQMKRKRSCFVVLSFLALALTSACRHDSAPASEESGLPGGRSTALSCVASKSPVNFIAPLRQSAVQVAHAAKNSYQYLKFCEANLQKDLRSFCSEKSCDLTFFDQMSVVAPVSPGINLIVKVEKAQVKPGEVCPHSLTVGLGSEPICLGEILGVSAFAGINFSREVAEDGHTFIKPSVVGAVACSNPLFTMAAAVDQEGVTPLNIRASRDVGGVFSHGQGVNLAVKKITWKEIGEACQKAMCGG